MSKEETNPELDFERISVLYENTNVGYSGIAVGIAYIPRIIISVTFSRKMKAREITFENVKPWENYFFYSSIIPFLCFSSAVFIPFEQNEFIALLYYEVIVMTLISGGILSYSTSLPAIFLFMNASMLPLIVKTFWIQEALFNALGLLLLFANFTPQSSSE